MKAIQGFIAVCFSCVLLGGLYIGSMVLGYFFAILGVVLTILFTVVGVIILVAYTVMETVTHLVKKKP